MAKEDIRLSMSLLSQWEQTASTTLFIDLTKKEESLAQA